MRFEKREEHVVIQRLLFFSRDEVERNTGVNPQETAPLSDERDTAQREFPLSASQRRDEERRRQKGRKVTREKRPTSRIFAKVSLASG